MTTRPSHRPSPRCLTVPVPLFRFSVSLPRSQPLSEQIFHEAANDTAGGFLHIRCDVGVLLHLRLYLGQFYLDTGNISLNFSNIHNFFFLKGIHIPGDIQVEVVLLNLVEGGHITVFMTMVAFPLFIIAGGFIERGGPGKLRQSAARPRQGWPCNDDVRLLRYFRRDLWLLLCG